MLENVTSIDALLAKIETQSGSVLFAKWNEYKKKSKELAKDDKEHSKVLNALLEKLQDTMPISVLKITAWMWFD